MNTAHRINKEDVYQSLIDIFDSGIIINTIGLSLAETDEFYEDKIRNLNVETRAKILKCDMRDTFKILSDRAAVVLCRFDKTKTYDRRVYFLLSETNITANLLVLRDACNKLFNAMKILRIEREDELATLRMLEEEMLSDGLNMKSKELAAMQLQDLDQQHPLNALTYTEMLFNVLNMERPVSLLAQRVEIALNARGKQERGKEELEKGFTESRNVYSY